MTTQDFFQKISEMEVNILFFMFGEQAVEGLNRLNQQRKWIARPEGKFPRI